MIFLEVIMEKLNLCSSGNRICDEGVKMICESLMNKTITTLVLEGTGTMK